MPSLKILYIALSCGPNLGSEDAVGWRIPLEALRAGNDVTVLTRGDKRVEIEAYIKNHPNDCFPNFIYHDLSRVAQQLKGPFYTARAQIWCSEVSNLLPAICSKGNFDVVHQITPVEFRSIVDMSDINALRVLGPLGGGGPIDPILKDNCLVLSERFIEALWASMNVLSVRSSRAKRALSSFDLVFATNHETKDELKKMDKSKHVAIHSEVAASSVVRHSKDRTSRLVIGFAGRLHYRKGITFLLDVASQFSSECLDVLIAGDGPLRAEIESSIIERKLEDRVELIGSVPHDQINDFYNRLDIFAFPSFREATGSVLVEALAAGLPCVSFKSFGAEELLKERPGCLVPVCSTYEETVQAFADAIRTVGRHPHDYTLTPATWADQASFFIDTYDRAINDRDN